MIRPPYDREPLTAWTQRHSETLTIWPQFDRDALTTRATQRWLLVSAAPRPWLFVKDALVSVGLGRRWLVVSAQAPHRDCDALKT